MCFRFAPERTVLCKLAFTFIPHKSSDRKFLQITHLTFFSTTTYINCAIRVWVLCIAFTEKACVNFQKRSHLLLIRVDFMQRFPQLQITKQSIKPES